MTSLYKRASIRQRRVLRIIEGAVRNAAHAHPECNLLPTFARSVAKRATGTLTAQWPDVLALPREASDSANAKLHGGARAPDGDIGFHRLSGRGGSHRISGRPSFRRLHLALGRLAGDARRAGNMDRYAGLVDALRMVGAVLKGE